MKYIDLIHYILFIKLLDKKGLYQIKNFDFNETIQNAIRNYNEPKDFNKIIDFEFEKHAILNKMGLKEKQLQIEFLAKIMDKKDEILKIKNNIKLSDEVSNEINWFKKQSDKYTKFIPKIKKEKREAENIDTQFENMCKQLMELLANNGAKGNPAKGNPAIKSENIQLVIQNELDTLKAPQPGVTNSKISLAVYQYILQAFLGANPTLSTSHRDLIEQQISIFNELEKQTNICDDILKKYKNDEHNPDYETKISELVNQQYQSLVKNKSIYIRAGHSPIEGMGAHAAYIRIYEENGKYYRTDYNAGAGATFNPNKKGEVWSVCTREIQKPTKENIRTMLTLAYQKRTRAHNLLSYRILESKEDSLLSEVCSAPIPEKSHSSKPQGKGNCSSRSLREILRANLPEKLFDQTQEYIEENDNKVKQIKQNFENYIKANKKIQDKTKKRFTTLDTNWREFTSSDGKSYFGYFETLSQSEAETIKNILVNTFGLRAKGIELLKSGSQKGKYRLIFNNNFQILNSKQFESMFTKLQPGNFKSSIFTLAQEQEKLNKQPASSIGFHVILKEKTFYLELRDKGNYPTKQYKLYRNFEDRQLNVGGKDGIPIKLAISMVQTIKMYNVNFKNSLLNEEYKELKSKNHYFIIENPDENKSEHPYVLYWPEENQNGTIVYKSQPISVQNNQIANLENIFLNSLLSKSNMLHCPDGFKQIVENTTALAKNRQTQKEHRAKIDQVKSTDLVEVVALNTQEIILQIPKAIIHKHLHNINPAPSSLYLKLTLNDNNSPSNGLPVGVQSLAYSEDNKEYWTQDDIMMRAFKDRLEQLAKDICDAGPDKNFVYEAENLNYNDLVVRANQNNQQRLQH